MSFLVRWLNRLIPEDKEVGCGFGPFKLSDDHPFVPACTLHDMAFDDAHRGVNDKDLSEVDWDLFFRMVLIAKAQGTPELRCAYAMEICMEWPLARFVGGVLWDGDAKAFKSDTNPELKSQVKSFMDIQKTLALAGSKALGSQS